MRRLGRLEKKYVWEVLRSEFRSSMSSNMRSRFELAFSSTNSVKHSLAFTNGTATLHCALEALGVGVGDEVIVPPLTMAATTFAVLHSGATPIFADVDEETWQLSPASVKKNLSASTKAIMPVALYGGSPDYDAISKAAPGLPIVSDNAEAFGTKYHGNPISKYATFSSYSFQASKHLTAGEGGVLCTNDDSLAERARLVQTLGYSAVKKAATSHIPKSMIQSPSYLRHESLGWNYRMPELAAAVALGQTERLEQLVSRRKLVAEALRNELDRFDWVHFQESYPDSVHSYWALAFRIDRPEHVWRNLHAEVVNSGGKGFYGAWALTYKEPALVGGDLLGREKFFTRPLDEITHPDCPVSEALQPKIVAMRTNEWTQKSLKNQISAVRRSFKKFN